MNYLGNADQDLSNFQGVLSAYKATIAPPSGLSDQAVFILGAAALTIAAILIIK